MFNVSKRYQDIIEKYFYKGEKTPFTLGTLVVCGFCFLLIILASFTQFNVVLPWSTNSIAYNPQIPVIIFVIYLLRRGYSLFVLLLYLIVGLFVLPIFPFGGGIDYFQNYLFGYYLGFFVATVLMGTILNMAHNIKSRIISSLIGIISIHIVGLIYCFFLALFKVIDFNLLGPIANAVTFSKILYDIFFSIVIILIAPYIKNFFWICMKPKPDKKKKKAVEYQQ